MSRIPMALVLLFLAAGCSTTTTLRARVPGAVAAPESYATDAGERVLVEGGNAVDAAVCVGFVLAVTHPAAGNLGGGGFMLVRAKDGDMVIDAREVAPRAATPDMYLDKEGRVRRNASLVGPLAAGVPGSVAGYLMLHARLGKLSRERVLAPAIRFAERGFKVDAGLHASLARNRELLATYPETARIFLPGGSVPAKGDRFRQPDLAKVLRAISKQGADGFYRGRFPEQVQQACEKHDGVLTIGDFYTYQAKVRRPLRRAYRDYEILTMPPPSSGGVVLLQMLDMIERGGYDQMRPEQRLHLLAEAGRRAFADRATYFADPDFVDVPVKRLLDDRYLAERFATIRMDHATPSAEITGGALPVGGSDTCHFSVVDKDGMAVSCTTTLNGAYGCGLVVGGVLLNNEMDDFTIKPGSPNQFGLVQSDRNAIAPGKRPLSSMTPTIVLKSGRPYLVLGSPGGPTIISTVCQVIANHLAVGMTLEQAVAHPRIHQQWLPDEVLFERLTAAERRSLQSLGHRLRQRKGPMGDVQAVGYTPIGTLVGMSDPRGRGRGTRR